VAPAGWVETSSDCDDTSALVNPAASEVCNLIDDDCNGDIDDADAGVTDSAVWYLDADLDGYGDGAMSMTSCFATTGYVADGTDCDDTDGARSPGAEEIDGDGMDNNCVNDPPSILLLEISPADARTDDTLSLVIESSDPDGDSVTHDINWSIDGIIASMGSEELSSELFGRDQVISVVVSPTDGVATGDDVEAMLTVANTPPEPPALSILPGAPLPGDDLVCEIEDAGDADDGDMVSFTVAWMVEGSPFIDTSTTIWPGDTVPGAYVGAVESWTCIATPSDGTDEGSEAAVAIMTEPDPVVLYSHDNGRGVSWSNEVPTGTHNSDQARLSCEQSYGAGGCSLETGDCAGHGWCNGGICWGWTSGCSGGAGRVWQYGSSYTTYGTWN
jgi:hypothetical protein